MPTVARRKALKRRSSRVLARVLAGARMSASSTAIGSGGLVAPSFAIVSRRAWTCWQNISDGAHAKELGTYRFEGGRAGG